MQSELQVQGLEVFFSYAHEDEELRDRLAKHLAILERQRVISAWYDRQIEPGSNWAGEINHRLNSAHIILLLVSADFLASDYCYETEMTIALERHNRAEARVIPIILRPVDWQKAPFSRLQALPKDGKPVTTWSNIDEAFLDIARGIRSAAKKFQNTCVGTSTPNAEAGNFKVHPALESCFKTLFLPLQKPEKGIAVLARRRAETVPSFVPIEVRFFPGDRPTGEISFADEALHTLTNEAVQWAGNYARRFKGNLRQVFQENHWGSHKPYGCALFHLPEAKYESSPAIFAGMVLAYLSEFIHGILVYDLEMPLEFPESLFLCAAGFKSDHTGIISEEGLSEAIGQLQVENPTRVIYARGQQEDVVHIPRDFLPKPVDNSQNVIEAWFNMLMDEIKSPAEAYFRQKFKNNLNDLLKQEKDLKAAESALLSREARMRELENEILILQRELDFLNNKYTEIKQKLNKYQKIPLPSEVLAEYTSMREDLREQILSEEHAVESEQIKVIIAEPEQRLDMEICRRLYRRLANLCHPDKETDEGIWFIHLVEHRHDRIWLESMEGALDPFGTQPIQPRMDDSISQLFDRLFALQATNIKLKERINNLKSDVASYGEERKTRVGDEEQKLKALIRMRRFDIDNAWCQLNRLLGKEFFSSPGHNEGVDDG